MASMIRMTSGSLEKSVLTPHESGGRPMQCPGDFPSFSRSSVRPSAETVVDGDSVRSMEERYGIGEEGLF